MKICSRFKIKRKSNRIYCKKCVISLQHHCSDKENSSSNSCRILCSRAKKAMDALLMKTLDSWLPTRSIQLEELLAGVKVAFSRESQLIIQKKARVIAFLKMSFYPKGLLSQKHSKIWINQFNSQLPLLNPNLKCSIKKFLQEKKLHPLKIMSQMQLKCKRL